jgi:hypothetical protein
LPAVEAATRPALRLQIIYAGEAVQWRFVAWLGVARGGSGQYFETFRAFLLMIR